MSIRLHRAMGWGMKFSRFKQHINIHNDIPACAWLEKKFDSLTVKDLTYKPEPVMDQLKYSGSEARPYPVIMRNLLALKYHEPEEETESGDAYDLYTVTDVGGDDTDYIIFYPNLYYRKKWYRVGDDLDYAFEQAVKVNGNQDPDLADFTHQLKFNHYPWTNSLMTLDGQPVAWRDFRTLENETDWAPAVPTEIRWYLTQHDILSNEGVNELRPIAAQYWC